MADVIGQKFEGEMVRVLKDNGKTALTRVFAVDRAGKLRGWKDVELPTNRASFDEYVKLSGGPDRVRARARQARYVEIRASIKAGGKDGKNDNAPLV